MAKVCIKLQVTLSNLNRSRSRSRSSPWSAMPYGLLAFLDHTGYFFFFHNVCVK